MKIDDKYIDDYAKYGFVKIPNFFDIESEVIPVQEEIRDVIEVIGKKIVSNSELHLKSFDDANVFFNELKIADKKAGSVLYDAMKHLNGLYGVIANRKIANLLKLLWPDGMPKVAAYGSGIRINHPNEPQFFAPWHQELHYQGRSMRGVVLWMPLVKVTKQLGPVEICSGSHHEGPLKVFRNKNADTIYDVEIVDVDKVINKYETVSPLSEPGDAIFIDFLTLHKSGVNVSDRSLWSIQVRYFDMLNEKGIEITWGGPKITRAETEILFPELFQ